MTKNPSPKKVFIADDDELLVRIIRARLLKDGYKVVVCEKGCDILNEIKKEKPHLIISELMIPGYSGFEVLETIKSKKPAPIVLVLTRLTQEEDYNQAKTIGVDGYFMKPRITFNEIMDEVHRRLD